MQRELKFRAWDEDLGMSEPFDLEGAGIMFLEGGNPDSIMQYTGLRDKNGKEIYEGDIVRIDETEDIDVVDWTDGKEYGIGFGLFSCFKYEIIGNIYENPELLKEGE